MGSTIVVGVDGSDTASKAADAAAALASATNSPLHVITAYAEERSEEIGAGSDRWVVSSGDRAAQVAATEARRLSGTVVNVTSSSGYGKPDDVLLAAADRLEAAMIVVGNRRMQGASRILGSVANSVAHRAPCDVYIVKTV